MRGLIAAAGLAAFALAAAPAGAGEEAWSGKPLAEYCSRVPDLSVKREDAVHDWIAICEVWFHARCPQAETKTPARMRGDPSGRPGPQVEAAGLRPAGLRHAGANR